jgi:hypothetical protein
MPDRHSELPAHPDLEYYRKQAKHLLRSYEAGDAAARDRAAQADFLLTGLRRGDPDALARLRAHVPRYAAATDASAAELRDARLVIAREVGFGTWRELVAGAEKAQRDEAERQERWRSMC